MNGSFGYCPWTEETGLTNDDNIPSPWRSRDDASYSKKIQFERDTVYTVTMAPPRFLLRDRQTWNGSSLMLG